MDRAENTKLEKSSSNSGTASLQADVEFRPRNPFEDLSKRQTNSDDARPKNEPAKSDASKSDAAKPDAPKLDGTKSVAGNAEKSEVLRPSNPFDAPAGTKKNDSQTDAKKENKAEPPADPVKRPEPRPDGRLEQIPIKVPGLPDFWLYDGKLKPGLADPRVDKPTDGNTPVEPQRPQQTKPQDGATKQPDASSKPQQSPDIQPGQRDGDPRDRFKPDGTWSKPNSNLPFVPGDTKPAFPKRDTEKEIPNPTSGPQTPERVVELFRMNNRSADHNGPDAVVRLPKNFDPSKPINLVVYNHGWGDTVQSSFRNTNMNQQMDEAPPNTVLILPEWQAQAGASNGNQGRFREQGRFKAFLQEVLDKTPGLNGKTLNDVKNLDIISHSAGDNATLSEVNNNGLEKKITSITLLDSMYNTSTGFDNWIQSNIHEIAKGTKQFRNIYFDKAGPSRAQADRVRNMLTQAGYSSNLVYQDDRRGQPIMTASELARNSIVFKYSDIGGGGAHGTIPKIYVAPVQGAFKQMRR